MAAVEVAARALPGEDHRASATVVEQLVPQAAEDLREADEVPVGTERKTGDRYDGGGLAAVAVDEQEPQPLCADGRDDRADAGEHLLLGRQQREVDRWRGHVDSVARSGGARGRPRKSVDNRSRCGQLSARVGPTASLLAGPA